MGLIGLIIILLVVAFLLRVDFIYYIVYVSAGVYILSRWYAPRALRHLRLERQYNDHAFLGESVDVQIRCENLSRLPLPWMELLESVPPELRKGDTLKRVAHIKGRETRVFNYQVEAGRRGYYRLGPLRLTTGDLFGLAKGTTGYHEENYLTVYPRIVSLSALGFHSRLPYGTIAARQPLFADPARPVGVREYHPGDSQRHINWKMSAHIDQLMVKRFQPAISLESAVLLNLHSADYSPREHRFLTEWAIVTAASLAVHLVDQRQAVGLMTNGIDPLQGTSNSPEPEFNEDSGRLLLPAQSLEPAASAMPLAIPPRPGRVHLMKILEYLARIESGSTLPFSSWAVNACLGLSWGMTVLAITARGDEETCQSVHHLVRLGFNPILIAVEADHNFSQVRERARYLGFRAFNITETKGLSEWRRPVQQRQR